MAINETKIVIKAVDEASPVFVDMQGKLKGLDNSFKEVSKSTSGLSKHIKEQRIEGRQHAFIMGEIKDALAVVGLAMNLLGDSTGKGNEEFKKINDSVNKGIVAFYGLDAVVSTLSKTFKFLGGGVGLAITAIGAIALAIVDFINKSKGAAEATEIEKTSHDRIVESLKAAKTAYESLASVKKVIAQKDKEEIENNLKLVDQWIKSDEAKLKSVNDQLKWADESEKSLKLRLFGEQNYLSNLIEINKQKKKFYQEDLDRIQQTLDFENKTQAIKSDKLSSWNFFQLQGNLDMNTKLILGRQEVTAAEIAENLKRWENSKLTAASIGAEYQALGQQIGQSIMNGEPAVKAALKAIAMHYIDLAQASLLASKVAAIGNSIWTFGASSFKDLAELVAGTAALTALRGYVASMHSGGQAFVNAPADREVPIMVRGQETIRVTTPEQERRSGSGGVVINFNSPVSDVQFVRNSIKKVLQETGLSVNQAFVNNQNNIAIA